jgi:hypothetical protein
MDLPPEALSSPWTRSIAEKWQVEREKREERTNV